MKRFRGSTIQTGRGGEEDVADIFRVAFIAPCSSTWYIFHELSLKKTEKVNIEPNPHHPWKKREKNQVKLDFWGHCDFVVGNTMT